MDELFRRLFDVFESPLRVIAALADILTLLTLVFAFQVTKRLRDQERSIVGRLVLPKFSADLKGFLTNLRTAQTTKKFSNIRKNLPLCRSTLNALAPYVDKQLRRQIVQLSVVITELLAGIDDDAMLRKTNEVSAELGGILQSVQNRQIELSWRKSDDQC